METHLRHKGEEPGGNVTARKQTVEEEEETAGSKRRRREEEEANSGNPWPCVSMVIRVEQKEGVSWRNTGAEAEDQEAGLRLCFSVKAAVIGPVVSWRRDPKNEPMTEKESEQKQERKVRDAPVCVYLSSPGYTVTCLCACRWCWCSQVCVRGGFLSSSLDVSTDSSPLTLR